MRLVKRVKILNSGRSKLVLVLILLIILFLGAAVVYQKPDKKTDDKPNDNPPAPQSLVTFPNEESKKKFLESNNLSESDLTATEGLENTYVVPVPNDQLKADGATVAPRREYKALLTPNDTIYPQWYTTSIAAPSAWDITTGSSSVTVAVIDTGFALNHEDMSNRWFINNGEYGGGKETNGLDDDSSGLVDDWRGWDFAQNDNNPIAGSVSPTGQGVNHGTITSGLIGATGNNAKGVASVSWGTVVLPLQALDDSGTGYTEDITAGINYAVARGAKVISLSLGSTGADPTLQAAITSAVNSGVTIIAAAGNCGDPGTYILNGCDYVGQILYPAKYSNVIAVGASDQSDNRASFSSYGPEVDLIAPGAGTIQSTNWSQANQTTLYTSTANGTSIATPVVAGTVGLLYSYLSNITPAEVSTTLINTADKVSQMSGATRTDQHGYGRLNANRALQYTGTSHPDGTLIYNSSHTGVLLVEGAKTRGIVSGNIFTNQGFDWSKIKNPNLGDSRLVADTALSNYREGALLESQGGIFAVDITGAGEVQKRPFYSWGAFVNLGYSLSNTVKVSAGELPAANGTPITDASLHPDGTLIYNATHSGVQIIDGGQVRNIISGNVFQSYSFSWNNVKNPTSGDLALAAGSNYPFREGTLLLYGGGIYVADTNGSTAQKRAIGSWDTFVGLGYNLNEVLSISAGELPGSNGTTIVY